MSLGGEGAYGGGGDVVAAMGGRVSEMVMGTGRDIHLPHLLVLLFEVCDYCFEAFVAGFGAGSWLIYEAWDGEVDVWFYVVHVSSEWEVSLVETVYWQVVVKYSH